MSSLYTAILINAVVLAVVLEADLGLHRKVSRFRVLRPIISAALIVPFFFKGVATGGAGLLLEVAGTIGGLLLGQLAGKLLTVYRSDRTGGPVSRAGLPYAALWIGVIGARTLFSYGAAHWFGPQLAAWLTNNSITTDALTDALIFMAVAMLLARSASLGARAIGLPRSSAPVNTSARPSHV